MDTDKSPRLPTLDTANYGPWYLALQAYAATIDATEHIESNPAEQTQQPAQKEYHTKKNRLLTAILRSVSIDILGLIIVPEDKPTPHDLTTNIINHINQSTKDDHQYLKTEAETIPYNTDTTIDQYIQSHVQIRQKMIAAKYPNIKDEETTVDFIIAGL